MKRRLTTTLVVLAALLTYGASALAQRQDFEDQGFYQSYKFAIPDEPSEAWTLAFGGRLYDQWWAVLFTDPPIRTHPSYPNAGRKPVSESWRCVSCHGWDYRGQDGAYGSGLNYTGIVGIDGAIGGDPRGIVGVLRDDTHGFTEELVPDDAALALALFVSRGQVDAKNLVDPQTGQFAGDPERGRAIFQNLCAICHDFDGRAWIEGEAGIGNTLGAIANNDPWRAMHKVMNGQTYADMPAMRALGLRTVLDILSYVQTLPTE
jgi:thiosulfate dehydrogenase